MKHFYLFFLSVLALLGISLQANAEIKHHKLDLVWDEPGQVRIQETYGGPYVELAEDATSYHFEMDRDTEVDWSTPTIYITPGEGWFLETAVSTDGEKTYSASKQSIGLQLYDFAANERIFKLNLSPFVLDEEITIRVVNGIHDFSASFPDTGREIKFPSHEFTVKYSSEHEKKISFSYNRNNVINENNLDIYYVKRVDDFNDDNNYEEAENLFYWSYWLRVNEATLFDGAKFVCQAGTEPDPEEEKAKIKITYEGLGEDAVEMISNTYEGTMYSKYSDSEAPAVLELVKGTYARFAVNGYEYDVTITDNGNTTQIDNSECSVINPNVLYNIENIQEDHNVIISATEHVFPTTYVTIAIADPEGIIFRAGAIDGEEIDITKLTSYSTDTWDDVTYNVYSIPVSSKSPKIFFSASDGYYLREAFYFELNKRNSDKKIETGSAMQNTEDSYVFVRGHKISKDKNFVLYFKGDPENVNFKNHQREKIEIENNGYTVLNFDPVYDAPFSITGMFETSADKLYIFEDNKSVSSDENGVFSLAAGTTDAGGNYCDTKTVKIFTSVPQTSTLNVTAHKLSQFELIADKTRVVNHAEEKTHHFDTEFKIKPEDNTAISLDGVELTEKDNDGYHVFVANNSVHNLTASLIGDDPLEATVTPNDDLTEFTVTYPYASTVSLASTFSLDDVNLLNAEGEKVNTKATQKKVADAEHPTYVFTLTPAPAKSGNYTFSVGEGFFKIHGVDSDPVNEEFALKLPVTVSIDPASDSTVESLDEVTITFEGATTAELAGNYDISEIALISTDESYANIHSQTTIEKEGENSFKITFGPAPTRNTSYKLTIGTGLFVIDDEPYDEIITAEYTLAKPIDEVTYTLEPQGDQIFDSNTQWGINIGVVFNEEATVTVPDAETLASKLTVKFDDETVAYDATGNTGYMVGAEQNMFFIQLGMAYAKKLGTVSIDMAEGLLDFGAGVVSPAISHTWTVVAAKELEYTVNPDAGNVETPEDLAEFTVVFTNCTEGEVFQEFGAELSNGLYDSHRYSQRGTITQVEGAAQPTFKISFSPVPTEIGEYTLTIFEGAITVDNQGSPEIIKKYNLLTVGINGIAADANGKYNVMTIDGRIILKDADASQAKQLEKGIYIINGKKALVRK